VDISPSNGATGGRKLEFLFYILGAGGTLAPHPEAMTGNIVARACSLQPTACGRGGGRDVRARS